MMKIGIQNILIWDISQDCHSNYDVQQSDQNLIIWNFKIQNFLPVNEQPTRLSILIWFPGMSKQS